MIFCVRHNHWHVGARCDKCLAGEPHYRYCRKEVADPNEWRRFVKLGWVRYG